MDNDEIETPEQATANCLGWMVIVLGWFVGFGIALGVAYQTGHSVILAGILYIFATVVLVGITT